MGAWLVGGVSCAAARVVIGVVRGRLEAAETIRNEAAEVGQAGLTAITSVCVTIHFMHLSQADTLAGRYVGHGLCRDV